MKIIDKIKEKLYDLMVKKQIKDSCNSEIMPIE